MPRRSTNSRTSRLAAIACLILLAATPAVADPATALIREGDPMAGYGTVTGLNNPAVNHVGGYSLGLSSSDGVTTYSHIWGHPSGGSGHLLITEGVYGNYRIDTFESFLGFSDAGGSCYSPSATDLVGGGTGLDSLFLDTTPILVEAWPVSTLPGQYSTFNSRGLCTGDGQPTWVGGISTVQGGSTQGRVLFIGAGLTARLKTGDVVGGLGLPISSGGIDFDYRFSRLGTHYIMEALVSGATTTTDAVVVVDGNAATASGGILREGSPVPAGAGGIVGENWAFFDFFGITENGKRFITGDTSADAAKDEFVLLDEQIVLREGFEYVTPGGIYTVSGAIEGGYMNEDGDWAVSWDVNDPLLVNREALIVNGQLVLVEGDPVDLDGDGTAEPSSKLADFTGISSLVVGARNAQGIAPVYFVADIDTLGTPSTADDTEALLRLDVLVAAPNQAPVALCQDVTAAAGSSCASDADVDDGSYDPDGDPLDYTQVPPGPYGVGTTHVTLTVSDGRGGTDDCDALVTVVPEPIVLSVAPALLSWAPPVCDVGYDLVRGDLGALHAGAGDFTAATQECLADDTAATSLGYGGAPGSAGSGFWFLVRRIGTGGPGTYDSGGPGQVGSRDAEIAASAAACP